MRFDQLPRVSMVHSEEGGRERGEEKGREKEREREREKKKRGVGGEKRGETKSK